MSDEMIKRDLEAAYREPRVEDIAYSIEKFDVNPEAKGERARGTI
jgi:hypothetical protein